MWTRQDGSRAIIGIFSVRWQAGQKGDEEAEVNVGILGDWEGMEEKREQRRNDEDRGVCLGATARQLDGGGGGGGR